MEKKNVKAKDIKILKWMGKEVTERAIRLYQMGCIQPESPLHQFAFAVNTLMEDFEDYENEKAARRNKRKVKKQKKLILVNK